MYINPNTNIRLLKNVPLDNTYEHTWYPSSESTQSTTFMGYQKYNLTNYTYQRVNKGKLRVGIVADNLYDCNYMMFQNTAYGSKWFYAFITTVEYVNDVTSEITFELDDIQTWFFDFSFDECFVEREHVESDEIGVHIEPESVELGEYVFNDYGLLSGSYCEAGVVVIAIVDEDLTITGTYYNGTYSGCKLYCYLYSDTSSIKAKLQEYRDAPDSIVMMYTCPIVSCADDDGTIYVVTGASNEVPASTHSYEWEISDTGVTETDNLDGYLPKNNKLYTYPYNFYSINNGMGSDSVFRYEFFLDKTPHFKARANILPPVNVQLRAYNYKGSGTTNYVNETLTVDGYPMCSWSSDSFKAWVAQNGYSIAVGVSKSMASGAITGSLAGPVGTMAGAISGGALGMVDAGLSYYKASIAADISKGTLTSGNANIAGQIAGFYGGRCSITAEYARMIDDYFSRFGYNVRRLKEPIIKSTTQTARPHWNYLKTVGCNIQGSVPSDTARHICQIHDNGITYWTSMGEVGDYSLNNDPT